VEYLWLGDVAANGDVVYSSEVEEQDFFLTLETRVHRYRDGVREEIVGHHPDWRRYLPTSNGSTLERKTAVPAFRSLATSCPA
jgi:hypothetical protein